MKLHAVTTLREFDALAPLWGEITRTSGQSSPFVSHDWFACCWRSAGPNRRREVWILEDGGAPIALVPLLRSRTRIRGLPARALQIMDAPDTPYADFPMVSRPDAVIPVLLDALRARGDWDVLSIGKLPADSMTRKALEVALPGQLPWRIARREQSPYLSVSGTWEEFFRGKTQRFRKTCRNIENRIERAGKVTLEEHRTVDPDGPLFAELMEVSEQSWKGPRGVAMATMQRMPRFFHELTRRANANGWLHVWILRVDGRAVATEYQIGAEGCVHALRADYDALDAELSPGAVLNLRIARALFDRQVHEYDMGPGTNEYKLRWATGIREAAAVEVFAPTPYGRVLHGIETRLVPLARRWRERIRERCA